MLTGSPADLLRAGVGGCQGSHRVIGEAESVFAISTLIAQQFRDAEIEQLGLALGRDQNVAGLDVPVDHQVAVGERDRLANLAEQCAALRDAQLSFRTPGVDGLSLDVFENEEGAAVKARPAIEKARDVGMIEHGENLAFLTEAFQHCVRVDAALDQFDGDLLVEFIVGAGCQIDGAHATAPDFADYLISPETGALH